MNDEKIREVLDLYRRHLDAQGIGPPPCLPWSIIDEYPCAVLDTARAELIEPQLRLLVRSLRDIFRENGVRPARFDLEARTTARQAVLGHCCQMLDPILAFLDEGRTDKALRWYGFAYGCLYVTNRPAGRKPELLAACRLVLDDAGLLLDEGDRANSFVALGFCQGCFFAVGEFSIGEMAAHNRPAGPAAAPA